jgi:hypothetical protein
VSKKFIDKGENIEKIYEVFVIFGFKGRFINKIRWGILSPLSTSQKKFMKQ